MTRDEVDAFFAAPDKRCPADFAWPERAIRKNERRARQQVEAAGGLTRVEIEIIIRMHEPDFLVVVLLAPTCVTRLCLGSPHYDAKERILIEDGHLHPWHSNRPRGQKLPDYLRQYEVLPSEIITRDAAFAWFLHRHDIEFRAPAWPDSKGIF